MTTGDAAEVDQTSFLSRAFAEIVHRKRTRAYQTTFVSVRITPLTEGRIFIESKTCGDSALLVFDSKGRLVLNNLRLTDGAPFTHTSPITEVLPDHFADERVTDAGEFDDSVHVVLCTDGFYDAFPAPSALFRWLLCNGEALATDAERTLDVLHERLDQHRGDDDIAVIWLCPRLDESPPSIVTPVDPPRQQEHRARTFAAILHKLWLRLTRLFPRFSGGIPC
jgi:hypothetical protein